jgi:hypothetical protein
MSGLAMEPDMTGTGQKGASGFVKPKPPILPPCRRPAQRTKPNEDPPDPSSSSSSSEQSRATSNHEKLQRRKKREEDKLRSAERRLQMESQARKEKIADLEKEREIRKETKRLAEEELRLKRKLLRLGKETKRRTPSSSSEVSSTVSKTESGSDNGASGFQPADAPPSVQTAFVHNGTTYYPVPTAGTAVFQLPTSAGGPMDTWFLGDQALRAIPVFSGKVQDYPNWIRLAKKYADLAGISEETKLTDLKKKLSGRPAELVSRISSMDSKAVSRFFKELKQEYGDARAVYLSQMKRIENIPAPSFKYEEMRVFYCTIKDVVSCLKTLGIEPPKPDPTLEKLVAKLPPSWRTSFFEKYEQRIADSDDEDPDEDKLYSTSAKASVQDLLQYLHFKIGYLRRAEQTQEMAGAETGRQRKNSDPDKSPARAARTYANLPKDADKEAEKLEKAVKSEEKSQQKKPYCYQCKKEGHSLAKCKAYKKMTPSERVQLAYDNHLHFWCLEPHRNFKDCSKIECNRDGKVTSKCPVEGCKWVHHKSLHGGRLRMAPRHQRWSDDEGNQECNKSDCSDGRSNCSQGRRSGTALSSSD